MAASTQYNDGGQFVFTYKFDQQTNAWISNGNHSVSGEHTFLALRKDVLVATVSDENRPEMCGIVYKLSTAATIRDNNNDINDENNNNNDDDNTSSNVKVEWKEFARLISKDYPTVYELVVRAVQIQENMVFTGRHPHDRRYEVPGMVFVHYLPNDKN